MKGLKILVAVLRVKTHIHRTWYIAFFLGSGIIASQLSENYPLWQRAVFGIIGFFSFYVVVVIRQYLLNLLAVSIGIPLKNATLYIFGGAVSVPRDATSPSRELVVAFAGLFLNLLIGIGFQFLSVNERIINEPLIVPLIQWEAFFWYALALFHIIPGFPLEGGKILMIILWKATKNYIKAVRIAARFGWILGMIFLLGGVADLILRREIINGFLLVLLGWVLQIAASQVHRRSLLLEVLHYARALNVMTLEYPPIAPNLNLSQVVYEYAIVTGQDYFTVAEQGKLLGILTIKNIKKVRKSKWYATPVKSVMMPVRRVKTIQAGQSGAHAVELMDQMGLEQIPVLAGDELLGVVKMDSLIQLADVHYLLKL